MRINSGTHDLQLYYPPVPEANRLPFEEIPIHRQWKKYGKGKLRIHIHQGDSTDDVISMAPSEIITDQDTEDVDIKVFYKII